jgi:hypothetical protein
MPLDDSREVCLPERVCTEDMKPQSLCRLHCNLYDTEDRKVEERYSLGIAMNNTGLARTMRLNVEERSTAICSSSPFFFL